MVDMASIARYHAKRAAGAVGGSVRYDVGKPVYSPGTEAAMREAAIQKAAAAAKEKRATRRDEKLVAKLAALKKAKAVNGTIKFVGGTSYEVVPPKEEPFRGYGMEFATAETIPYGPVDAGEKKGFLDWLFGTPFWSPFGGKLRPTPSVTPPGETPPVPGECPQGLMYDKPLVHGCDAGYVPYDPGIGQKEICICVSRYGEARAMLKPTVSDKNGVGKGFGGLEAVVDILPTIVLGAVAVAAMGMFKK